MRYTIFTRLRHSKATTAAVLSVLNVSVTFKCHITNFKFMKTDVNKNIYLIKYFHLPKTQLTADHAKEDTVSLTLTVLHNPIYCTRSNITFAVYKLLFLKIRSMIIILVGFLSRAVVH